MRTAFLLFCVFSVLACPYECAVSQALARSVEQRVESKCCEKCAARQLPENTEDQSPASPPGNDDGRACFCDGAVFDVAVRASLDESLEVSLWTWVATAELNAGNCELSSRLARLDLPPPPQGRLTRIELGSLRL